MVRRRQCVKLRPYSIICLTPFSFILTESLFSFLSVVFLPWKIPKCPTSMCTDTLSFACFFSLLFSPSHFFFSHCFKIKQRIEMNHIFDKVLVFLISLFRKTLYSILYLLISALSKICRRHYTSISFQQFH